jgi:Fe-S-cluster containining protein
MPIYDPPDGSTDPRPRCTGHCCRGFSLEHPHAKVKEEYATWLIDPARATSIPDVAFIADMLIPLGTFRGQELFTCKHLSKEGNCTAYEKRPKMCRDFPGPNPCAYRNCASHGPQGALRRALNWLKE